MIRSALRFCAGAMLVSCFACAQVPPAPAPPPPPPAPFGPGVARVQCSDAASFAGAAQMTASDPVDPRGDPLPAGAVTDPNIKAGLAAAYNAAPQFFRDQLCGRNGAPGLDGLFITTAPQSWGYRNPANPQNLKRYIALSTSLFPPGTTGVAFGTYMNRVFGPPWPPASAPAYVPAPAQNTPATAILAALAHEFGHVLWADVMIGTPGGPPSSGFCNRVFNQLWNGGPQQRTWQGFEVPDDNAITSLPGDPAGTKVGVKLMLAALANGNLAGAQKMLAFLLSPLRPFPTAFGAYSANEQFVETFMLFTLMNPAPPSVPPAPPPVTSLPLQISATLSQDIPKTLSQRPGLRLVVACFKTRFGTTLP
jgi:hypothetical protein